MNNERRNKELNRAIDKMTEYLESKGDLNFNQIIDAVMLIATKIRSVYRLLSPFEREYFANRYENLEALAEMIYYSSLTINFSCKF